MMVQDEDEWRIEALRQELGNERVVSFFVNCDDLARKVLTAVAAIPPKAEKPPSEEKLPGMFRQNLSTFMCYARADSGFVLGLAKRLKQAGANTWLDQLDIPTWSTVGSGD